ncbi:transposase [Streptomyces sp. NBC_00631]|uniref:transposase n=1 Tax=Streptomyces sp. NBC_00631 TaxID=2975793 RepID=UPI0030DE2B98
MHVHWVFVTKVRHKVLTGVYLRRMEEMMRPVCPDFECDLVEFNGADNPVHLLVNFPPKAAVTQAGQLPQRVSPPAAWGDLPAGGWGRDPRPGAPLLARQQALVRDLLRQTVGGAPFSVLRQYIERHNRPG